MAIRDGRGVRKRPADGEERSFPTHRTVPARRASREELRVATAAVAA